MKVTFKAYHAVAEWKWDLPEDSDDTCGICRVQFEGTCAKCKYPGDDCPIGIIHRRETPSEAFETPLTASISDRSMHALLPHALHR